MLRIPRWLVSSGLLIAAALSAPSSLRGDEPTLEGFLESGEFGLATKFAERQAPDVRDRFLGQIANAQFRNGGAKASQNSLSMIGSDLVRSSAIESMQKGQIGEGRGGGRGGAALADFDTLIDLIQTTIDPDSWEEAGGAGAVQPFPGGVYVDSQGLLNRKLDTRDEAPLIDLRAAARIASTNREVRTASKLRKVSLTRLEKEIQLRAALGQSPTEAMKYLAGLQRVQFVFVYPETGDIVIAGPAGDWRQDGEQRVVNRETGHPVLQLDDLVVLLRNARDNRGRFSCSINPRAENLARTQAFLAQSAARPVRPGNRAKWLEDFRSAVGRQDISVVGIDPRTRVANIIVEADYRMKLVGMGLEPGVQGVTSYLASLDAPPKEMSILRWWFTLNYDSVQTTKEGGAYQLHGQGVKVLSENELLDALGQRVHTGKSDVLNRQFAKSFTKHFDQLAIKYPIYAELRNVFDLALVAGLVQSQDLSQQVDWHLTHFGDPAKYQIRLGTAPTEVASIVNHRMINKKIVAFVSGGVSVDSSHYVAAKSIKLDEYGLLKGRRLESSPRSQLPQGRWWWD